MRNWLKDKYVLLTGAAGGIGRELTRYLILRYGAKVIGVGRNEEKLSALQASLGERAPSFSYFPLDISKRESWEYLREQLLAKGVSPVLLINNAGVFPPLRIGVEGSAEQITACLQNNFLSAVYGVEILSPLLRNSGKHLPGIVNISSSAALCPVIGAKAYVASKYALKGYTEGLRLEEKGKKYVGIFYPGATATELFREDENVRKSAINKIACSPQKMAKKIAKKLYKRRKRAVLGWDAKLMNLAAKIMPVKGPALVCKIMKLSKSVAFDNVFNTKN